MLAPGYGVLGGLGLSGLGGQASMTVAALWYPAARGRAIALVDLGTGIGAFAFIPLGQALLSWFGGWRAVLLAWAALLVLGIRPASLFQRLPPPAREAAGAAPGQATPGWTLRAAVRTGAFRYLALARWFSAMAFPLMNVHMVAFAVEAGAPPGQAAAALGTASLVSLGGRMLTGWLADRIGRAATLTLTCSRAVLGLGCLSTLAVHGSPRVALRLRAPLRPGPGLRRHRGRGAHRDIFAGPGFGVIYGWMSPAVGPGEAIGPWAGGVIYDATGSYLAGFAFVAAALVLAVVVMWRVRAPAGEVPGST
jgi:MFS family permease